MKGYIFVFFIIALSSWLTVQNQDYKKTAILDSWNVNIINCPVGAGE